MTKGVLAGKKIWKLRSSGWSNSCYFIDTDNNIMVEYLRGGETAGNYTKAGDFKELAAIRRR